MDVNMKDLKMVLIKTKTAQRLDRVRVIFDELTGVVLDDDQLVNACINYFLMSMDEDFTT